MNPKKPRRQSGNLLCVKALVRQDHGPRWRESQAHHPVSGHESQAHG